MNHLIGRGAYGSFFTYSHSCCSLATYLVALLISLTPNNRLVVADEATLARMLAEAPTAWEEVRQGYNGKEFTKAGKRVNTITISKFPQPIVISTVSREFQSYRVDNHLMIKRKSSELKPPGELKELAQVLPMVETTSEGIELLNKHYIGAIVESPSPAIESYKPLSESVESLESQMALDYETMPALRLGNAMIDRSIFKYPNFTAVKGYANYLIVDAEEFLNDKGEVRVKVTFDLALLKNGELSGTSTALQEAFAVLSPDHNWCVMEYHDSFDNGPSNPNSSLDQVFGYENQSQGFHPETIKITESWSDGAKNETVEEFSHLVDSKLTTDQFYFSAFGLPEPEGVGSSWLGTVATAAIVLVLLVILLRRKLSNAS